MKKVLTTTKQFDKIKAQKRKVVTTMTKKEMMNEIVSNTKLHSLSERYVNKVISKVDKERFNEVYDAFEKDKEHALFYYQILTSGIYA